MSLRWAIVIGAGLIGAAIGAAVTVVGPLWWLSWAVTWFGMIRLTYGRHRAHAE